MDRTLLNSTIEAPTLTSKLIAESGQDVQQEEYKSQFNVHLNNSIHIEDDPAKFIYDEQRIDYGEKSYEDLLLSTAIDCPLLTSNLMPQTTTTQIPLNDIQNSNSDSVKNADFFRKPVPAAPDFTSNDPIKVLSCLLLDEIDDFTLAIGL